MNKLILAAALLIPAAAQAAPPAGCLYDLSGPVEVLKAGDSAWTPARKGAALGEGDRVRTGARAWCELLFRDGSFVKLDPGSEAAADELKTAPGGRNFAFSFLGGKALWMASRLKVLAASKFTVRTPSAVCAVRGTDFAVLVSTDGETTVGLFEGAVAVAGAGREAELAKGQQAGTGPGGLLVAGRLSRLMKAEEKRAGRLRGRVERLRKRLAARETFLDEYMEKQAKALADFGNRREEKLKDRN